MEAETIQSEGVSSHIDTSEPIPQTITQPAPKAGKLARWKTTLEKIWYFIYSVLPHQWKNNRQNEIEQQWKGSLVGNFNPELAQEMRFEALSENQFKKIRLQSENIIERIAALLARLEYSNEIVPNFVILTVVIFYFIGAVSWILLFAPPDDLIRLLITILLYIFYFITARIWSLADWGLNYFLNQKGNYLYFSYAIALICGLIAYQLFPKIGTSHWIVSGIYYAVWGIGLLYSTFCITVLILTFSLQLKEWLFHVHHPVEALEDYLFICFARSIEEETWQDMIVKRDLIDWLSKSAIVIERFLPRHLHSGDLEIDHWFRRRASEVASTLRELKKDIITPLDDTPRQFSQAIFQAFVYTTTAEWGNLLSWAESLQERQSEKTPPQQVKTWAQKLWAALSQLISAAAPLLILWGIKQTGYVVQDNLLTYLTIGSISWAVLSLLYWIDPTIKDKVDLAKSVRDMISMPGANNS